MQPIQDHDNNETIIHPLLFGFICFGVGAIFGIVLCVFTLALV